MANTDDPRGFTPRLCLVPGVTAFPIWSGLLLANTKVGVGDALIGSVGYLQLALAASTAIAGVCLTPQATSVSTNPEILFTPAVSWILFSGQCSGTPTQAKIWTTCDIEGTTGIQEINEDATSTNAIRLMGLWGQSTMGQYAELLFMWNKSLFGITN